MRTKVLIADDHSLIRQGFVSMLADHKDFEVIAEAGDGLEALNKIRELKPDLAVLDISMPRMNGLDVAREAKKENLGVEFVILTMFKDKEYYDEAIEAGAKGYVLKENSRRDLVTAMSFVSHGMSYVSPMILKLLGDRKQALPAPVVKDIKNIMDQLTATEKKVLKFISENKTSNEVAEELGISYKTVRAHRNNICAKLNLKGFNALLAFAVENKALL